MDNIAQLPDIRAMLAEYHRRNSIRTITDFPFIDDGGSQRDFWSVTPSGDWFKDINEGRRLAKLIHRAARDKLISPYFVHDVMKIFPEQLSGIETGFLQGLSLGR